MSLCHLWCWFLSVFSHFVPHCDHFCACFVSVFSQLASLCSFKIILHSPLVSVELSDRRYLPQRYAVAASSCFLWVTCSFVFRWEPSGCGKAESVCRELKRAAAEIRRRTSQNNIWEEGAIFSSAFSPAVIRAAQSRGGKRGDCSECWSRHSEVQLWNTRRCDEFVRCSFVPF